MDLFKNKVGRPSNEIINKRKRFYFVIAALILVLISGITFFSVSFLRNSVNSKNKNASSSCVQPFNITFCENEGYYGRPQKDLIKKLQEMLKKAGYHYGYVNGNYGSYTVEAVKRAQKAYGLQVTGQADYQIVQRLASRYGYGYTVITYNSNGGSGTINGTKENRQFLMRVNSPISSTKLSKSNATHVGWTATAVSRTNSSNVYYYGCNNKKCTSPTIYTSAQKKALGSNFYPYVFVPGEIVSSDTFNRLESVSVNFTAYYCSGTGAYYTKSTSTCSGGKVAETPKTNTTTSEATYTLEVSKGGLFTNNKYYAANTKVSLTSIGKTAYVDTYNGVTLKIVGKYLSSLYSGYQGKACSGKTYPKVELIFYKNTNGKLVEIANKKVVKNITSASNELSLSVPIDVDYVAVNTYSASTNCNNESYGKKLDKYSKTIYFNAMPTISATAETSGVSKTSTSNYYNTDTFKNYTTKFTISKNNNSKYYYKYFAFDDTITGTKAIAEGSCKEIKSNTTTFSETIKIENKYPKIIQYVRVYRDKATCDADTSKVNGKISKKTLSASLKYTNDTVANYLTALSTTYDYLLTTVNSSGYKLLKYDINKISKDIGSQSVAECHYYSIAYGSYILLNSKKPSIVRSTTPTVVAYDSSQFGGCFVDSVYSKNCSVDVPNSLNYATLYATIIKKINKGIPVVIHTKNNVGEHWVLVVGYNANKTSISNNGNELLSNVWIIDPYGDSGYNNRTKTLWQGIAVNRYTCRSMLNANYRTWDYRTSAK